MLLLRGEARSAQRGWSDAMNVSLQETSFLMGRFMKSPFPGLHTESLCVYFPAHQAFTSSRIFWRKSSSIFRDRGANGKMKPSVVVAQVSRRMTKARFAASKAADSHQGATQPRETEAGVLTASQHMLKASEPSRGRMLLSAVVELSVRPGHQAVTASVCSARILRYLVYQLVDLIYWTVQKDIKCHNYTQFVADARSIQLWNFTLPLWLSFSSSN